MLEAKKCVELDAKHLDLIARRCRRMGFRGADLDDASQEAAIAVMLFEFDEERANGASLETALTAVIDHCLLSLRRKHGRYAKHLEQFLDAAHAKWSNCDKDDESERNRREESDFLKYENSDGLYADFHSNRHLFITSLERVGITPKMAQTLARHSDVRLTLGIYTHVGINDQAAAIESLPAPPVALTSVAVDERAIATGTDGNTPGSKKVPTVVPKMVPYGSHRRRYSSHRFAPESLRKGRGTRVNWIARSL